MNAQPEEGPWDEGVIRTGGNSARELTTDDSQNDHADNLCPTLREKSAFI